ncbi:MAG: exopolysaccharide biosynthesis protein, partial [Rhodospirillales bacterium]|nr:exopolysaccharide biosynthesis protein [Rhodospirillales bacterium]
MPQIIAERFTGLVVLVMAPVLVLPIPFCNDLPTWAVLLIS